CGKSLELRPEGDRARLAVHVERLLADPVPDQRELAALGIPDRDREHADEPRDGVDDAPLLERRQQDFGVRAPAESEAAPFEGSNTGMRSTVSTPSSAATRAARAFIIAISRAVISMEKNVVTSSRHARPTPPCHMCADSSGVSASRPYHGCCTTMTRSAWRCARTTRRRRCVSKCASITSGFGIVARMTFARARIERALRSQRP